MADGPDDAPGDAAAESADRPPLPADPLLAWALGGFHAALLVAVGVLAIHLDGRAGYLLQGLSTAAGLAAYVFLWATAWWAVRAWLRDGGALLDGLKWGTANALVVFAGGYVVVFLPLAANGPSAIRLLVVALGVGALVAVTVGALVGALFALIDHGLLRLGRRFVS